MEIRSAAAIVTGGASGLGGATAERLAKAGALVTIFDLNEELREAKAAELGGRFVKVDVSDEASVDTCPAAAHDVHGPARIVVCCAAIEIAAQTVENDG